MTKPSPERPGPDSMLVVARDEAIAVVTMNRPRKLNAMGRGFWPELRTVLAALEADGGVRCVIITGAGDKAFSAGGDIASLAELGGLVERRAYQQDAMRSFMAVEQSPLPIVAAVNGYAFGGGCELALACDMVIAAEHATFAMPEAGLGLVPGYGVLRAPDRIGRAMTKLLVMSRRPIDAATALRIGLAQLIVPGAELMAVARTLAGEIAQSSPLALEVGKKMIDRTLARAEFDYSVEALALLQAAPDVAEGTRAFLEKRQPRFRPRR
jgi:enoyl-CoA hydratase